MVNTMQTTHNKQDYKTAALKALFLVLGSLLYGVGTAAFLYPHSLLLGGTTGISVILNAFLPFSPAAILAVINYGLLFLALLLLGKEAALKNLAGSVLTTSTIGFFSTVFTAENRLIASPFVSAVVGAAIIALAGALMFYVGASSGGTDIVALILKKYSSLPEGRALLLTDILIVIIGGILSGPVIGISSFVGLLIKTFGIDFVIAQIRRFSWEK